MTIHHRFAKNAANELRHILEIDTTSEARAALAAPELLEALKKLYSAVYGNARPPKYAELACKRARAAIAKAKGDQP